MGSCAQRHSSAFLLVLPSYDIHVLVEKEAHSHTASHRFQFYGPQIVILHSQALTVRFSKLAELSGILTRVKNLSSLQKLSIYLQSPSF